MLNHIREQKGFAKVKMPLFIQPDELYYAYAQGKFRYEIKNILSQLVLVFQKGLIDYVGFVFDFKFAILELSSRLTHHFTDRTQGNGNG